MAKTGYKITVYLDDNPLSPTYMQTYEERTLDEETCPIETDDLVLVSSECEIDLSGYTGYRLEIYYNRTTGEYTENRVEDPECIESSDEEQWVASGSPYCETTDKGVNTGYMLQLQVQMNPELANYGEKRYQRWKSPECGSNDCPIWDEVSRQCHIEVTDCVATFDGTSDIVQIDINPLSTTYNQTRTANKEDSDCENCTQTVFSWVLVGDMCGDDSLLCSNGIQQTSTNSYTVSQKYKTIGNGTPIPMDEYQVVLKTEDDVDCGYIRPQYRWDLVSGQYLCDYETYTKYEMLVKMVSYDAGETWATKHPLETQRGNVIAYDSYDCGKPLYRWINSGEFVCTDYNPVVATLYLNDGTTVDVIELTSASLAQYATTTSAITVNSECREISDGAFEDFTMLESITMTDNVPVTIGSLLTEKMDILKIYVPDEAYGDYMEQWSGYTENILPMSVEEHWSYNGTYIDLLLNNIVESQFGSFYYLGSYLSGKNIYKDTIIESGPVFVLKSESSGCRVSESNDYDSNELYLGYPVGSSCSQTDKTAYYEIGKIPSAKTTAIIDFKLYSHNSYNNESRPTTTLVLNDTTYNHSYSYGNSWKTFDNINCTLVSDGDYKKINMTYKGTNFSRGSAFNSQKSAVRLHRYITLT